MNKEKEQPLIPEWQERMKLKDVLVAALFSPTLSIDPRVEQIELGELGQAAQGLVDQSLRDPEGLERYHIVYVTAAGEVIVTNREGKGSKIKDGQTSLVEIKIRLNGLQFLPRQFRQDRYLATIMHSHAPYEVPHSGADLGDLFLDIDEPIAQPLSYVISAEAQRLIFRGPQTPQWEKSTVESNVELWKKETYKEGNRVKHLARTRLEGLALDACIQAEFIRDLVRRYDLRVFWCPSAEEVATREHPDHIVEFYRTLT